MRSVVLGPGRVRTIARAQLGAAVRQRWFWFYAIGLALVAVALVRLVPGAEIAGYGAFGRSAAALVAIVHLVVPLMGLTLGAHVLAIGRDSGTFRFLLAHPISRSQLLAGTALGLGGAMLAATAAGFGVAGLASGAGAGTADLAAFLRVAALSWGLVAASLAIGLLIGALVRRPLSAVGAAVLVWLALVFLGDLGVMGMAMTTGLPIEALFAATVANPLEAFRLATVVAFQGSLDVLGPAGSYAVDRFGKGLGGLLVGVLLGWTVVAGAAAWLVFTRRDDL